MSTTSCMPCGSWKRSSTKCAIPVSLSRHNTTTSKKPKAERGLSKLGSQFVMKETGIRFLPVGTESRDVSPVRHTVTISRNEASERTRRRHLRKAQQAVGAVLDEVAPNQPGELWHSLVPSLNMQFSSDSESEDEEVDNVLINALTECYSNASTWDTRRQILSIMADKVTFRTLKKWIPGLTRVTTPGVILNLRKKMYQDRQPQAKKPSEGNTLLCYESLLPKCRC
ncbi:hypothetical protein ACROYT_G038578 [Oculina patagonica]